MHTDLKHVINRLRARARPRVLAHTIAIYVAYEDGAPKGHGSGVLLKIADTAFVLSCKHVLEEAAKKGAVLYTVGEEGSVLVPLVGVRYGWVDNNDIDLGFAQLPPDTAARLPSNKQFLRIDDLWLRPADPSALYLVVGYPVALTTPDHASKHIDSIPISFLSPLHTKETDRHVDGVTIALQFDANETGNADWERSRIPDLHGISGCGIWRLADLTKPPPRDWSPNDIKLIGIEHTWYKTSIVGSLVRELLAILSSEFPDLRPSIDLHRHQ